MLSNVTTSCVLRMVFALSLFMHAKFFFVFDLCLLRIYEDNVISKGKLVIEVSYFGWHIHSETHDLCDETNCPVAIGDFSVAHSQVMPGYTPPVSILL